MKVRKFNIKPNMLVFWLNVSEAWNALRALLWQRHAFENGDQMLVIGPVTVEWTP